MDVYVSCHAPLHNRSVGRSASAPNTIGCDCGPGAYSQPGLESIVTVTHYRTCAPVMVAVPEGIHQASSPILENEDGHAKHPSAITVLGCKGTHWPWRAGLWPHVPYAGAGPSAGLASLAPGTVGQVEWPGLLPLSITVSAFQAIKQITYYSPRAHTELFSTRTSASMQPEPASPTPAVCCILLACMSKLHLFQCTALNPQPSAVHHVSPAFSCLSIAVNHYAAWAPNGVLTCQQHPCNGQVAVHGQSVVHQGEVASFKVQQQIAEAEGWAHRDCLSRGIQAHHLYTECRNIKQAMINKVQQ